MNTSSLKNNMLRRYGHGSQTVVKLTDFLFKDCNNHCDFCFEHDQEFKSVCSSIPRFSSLTDRYIKSHVDYLASILSEYPSEKIKLTIMGGELFAFDLHPIKHYFESLFPILETLKNRISIQVVSNLIHSNLEYVFELLYVFQMRNIKYILNTSFDFGNTRFQTDSVQNLFEENVHRLAQHDLNIGCGIIMTRYMLESLAKHDSQAKIFDYLYQHFLIDFARLSGNFEYKLTADEMIELWKILINRYPNIIKTNLYSDVQSIRCCLNNKHILIAGNSQINACVSYVYQLYSQSKKSCHICKTDEILKHSIKNNCLGCPYFGYCIPSCPLDEQYNICEMKTAIDYYRTKYDKPI